MPHLTLIFQLRGAFLEGQPCLSCSHPIAQFYFFRGPMGKGVKFVHCLFFQAGPCTSWSWPVSLRLVNPVTCYKWLVRGSEYR